MKKERKVRRPSKIPHHMSISFDLLGNDEERLSQYMWLKALEKTTLAVYMQTMFQCEASGMTTDEVIDFFDEGMLTKEDLPIIKEWTK